MTEEHKTAEISTWFGLLPTELLFKIAIHLEGSDLLNALEIDEFKPFKDDMLLLQEISRQEHCITKAIRHDAQNFSQLYKGRVRAAESLRAQHTLDPNITTACDPRVHRLSVQRHCMARSSLSTSDVLSP